MVIINHHAQSNKSVVQDIALSYDGGQSEGDLSEILMIRSVRLSPLHDILVTTYKSEKKRSEHQH